MRGSYASAMRSADPGQGPGTAHRRQHPDRPRTIPELEPLLFTLLDLGVRHWQVQLTVAMGNAVDNDEVLLQPFQLLELMPLLARLHGIGRQHGL